MQSRKQDLELKVVFAASAMRSAVKLLFMQNDPVFSENSILRAFRRFSVLFKVEFVITLQILRIEIAPMLSLLYCTALFQTSRKRDDIKTC